MPLSVGQIALKPRRTFAGQVVLVGEEDARVVADFHADLRPAFERAEREDETGRAVARRFGGDQQREIAGKDGGKDLESRDVDGVVAFKEERRRTRGRRLDAARKTVRAAKVVEQIRGA